jgi:hypothetical protein
MKHRTLIALACGLLAAVTSARSHVVLDQPAAAAGSGYRAVFRVAHGCDGLPTAGITVVIPAGVQGPALLVFRNFDAIYSYNAAESYALAIATLSDRLRGGGALVTPWPTDDPGLGRGERRQLQTLLLALGYAIGTADGMVGTLTRRAIVAEQQRLGLQPQDGRAGRKILEALREQGPPVLPLP